MPTTDILQDLKPQHPRLLVTASTWQELRTRRQKSPTLDRFLQKLEDEGRFLLDAPPLTYHKIGRRLLLVSVTAHKRIVLWSFNYRVTGDEKFKARAEQEMLAVAAFPDWNPSHFLDVAEMTAALAMGYDWLYDALSVSSRDIIRRAIIEKGLKPGEDTKSSDNWWYASEGNWNLVCLNGMALGALAIADEEPALARKMLELVRIHNPAGLKSYAPDGCYPEGPMYCNGATILEVILLAALESALGTDWGLSQSPGFLAAADYLLETTGPTGLSFNYGDGRDTTDLNPAMFWMARKLQNRAALHVHRARLLRYLDEKKPLQLDTFRERFHPFLALWAEDLDQETSFDRPLAWHGRGRNPVAAFHSSWHDPDALYLAFKGGSAIVPHGHMDAGTFILEADGIRWAVDLGLQEYESLESKGYNLWDTSPQGARWKVFRYNNFNHNTLTIDGQLHQVEGHASIIRFSQNSDAPHAVVDLTAVFSGQADKVVRGFKILPQRRVLIQDELDGLKPGTNVRWTFVTGAEVTISGQCATLRQNGRQLQLVLASPADGAFAVLPGHSGNDYDAPNPGISILIAQAQAPESGRLVIQVFIQPDEVSVANSEQEIIPCENWSAPLPS